MGETILKKIQRHQLLLLQDQTFPNIVSLITQEKFKGSWWNKGRNIRVPNENSAGWFGILKDDLSQITRTNEAFQSGATGIQGWRPLRAFSKEMCTTGPTAAIRQFVERGLQSFGWIGGVSQNTIR